MSEAIIFEQGIPVARPVAAGQVCSRWPGGNVQAVSGGYRPFFPSEQLPHYAHALVQVYGTPEVLLHIPGRRGPKPTPKRLPPADWHEAQVVKRRKSGRGVEVTTQIIFGSEAAVQAREELLSYRVPPAFRDRLDQQATTNTS